MKKICLLLMLVITGCDSGNKLLGRWVTTDNKCNALCSFTIIESENAYSNMKAEFDKGLNGPLIKTGDNIYLAKLPLGDFLIVLKNDKIHGADGSVYIKK